MSFFQIKILSNKIDYKINDFIINYMPTKYTLEYVKKYFEENNCKLLETEYINQLQKLKYIASCGHNHIICFN